MPALAPHTTGYERYAARGRWFFRRVASGVRETSPANERSAGRLDAASHTRLRAVSLLGESDLFSLGMVYLLRSRHGHERGDSRMEAQS